MRSACRKPCRAGSSDFLAADHIACLGARIEAYADKAEQLGVPMLDEGAFEMLLREGPPADDPA